MQKILSMFNINKVELSETQSHPLYKDYVDYYDNYLKKSVTEIEGLKRKEVLDILAQMSVLLSSKSLFEKAAAGLEKDLAKKMEDKKIKVDAKATEWVTYRSLQWPLVNEDLLKQKFHGVLNETLLKKENQ